MAAEMFHSRSTRSPARVWLSEWGWGPSYLCRAPLQTLSSSTEWGRCLTWEDEDEEGTDAPDDADDLAEVGQEQGHGQRHGHPQHGQQPPDPRPRGLRQGPAPACPAAAPPPEILHHRPGGHTSAGGSSPAPAPPTGPPGRPSNCPACPAGPRFLASRCSPRTAPTLTRLSPQQGRQRRAPRGAVLDGLGSQAPVLTLASWTTLAKPPQLPASVISTADPPTQEPAPHPACPEL